MTRRSGLTLTEVLVTLAILAFGILGILTLFPLAASQMAIAVREDRSAQAAAAADGYMRSYWKSEFVTAPVGNAGAYEMAVMNAFDGSGCGLPIAAAGEPSYPVMIDPMGYTLRPGWVGDSPGCKVPRRTLAPLNGNSQYSFRACSLMDGMGYNDNGSPTPDRELRYNWAWMLQRPVMGGVNNNTATMDVIVYDNRPNLYAPTGSEGIFNTGGSWSTSPPGGVVPGSTSLTLTANPGPILPNVKAGMWIMDVTDPTVVGNPANKMRHAFFYQVVTMTPDLTGNAVYLELQTPLKKANDPTITGAYNGKFVVLKGVTNVYPRAPLTGN